MVNKYFLVLIIFVVQSWVQLSIHLDCRRRSRRRRLSDSWSRRWRRSSGSNLKEPSGTFLVVKSHGWFRGNQTWYIYIYMILYIYALFGFGQQHTWLLCDIYIWLFLVFFLFFFFLNPYKAYHIYHQVWLDDHFHRHLGPHPPQDQLDDQLALQLSLWLRWVAHGAWADGVVALGSDGTLHASLWDWKRGPKSQLFVNSELLSWLNWKLRVDSTVRTGQILAIWTSMKPVTTLWDGMLMTSSCSKAVVEKTKSTGEQKHGILISVWFRISVPVIP